MRVCAYCGSSFEWIRQPGQRGRVALYCSDLCKGRAAFARRKASGKYEVRALTPAQRRENASIAARTRWSRVDDDDRSVIGSALASARYTDAQRERSKVRRDRLIEKRNAPCAVCGTPVGNARRKTCSDECRLARIAEKMRTINAVRQRATSGIEVEHFRTVEIFARDGWVCGICHDPVDPSVRHPDKLSATIDHIVPLSLGGSHTRKNVRLAHLICNSRRGNRVAA